MKLTAKIKLLPSLEQRELLHQTLQWANDACNYISEIAWAQHKFNKLTLQKRCYGEVRTRFALSAQMTVRAFGKVADAYQKDKRSQRLFRQQGAFPYDSRILTYAIRQQTVSIWTLTGRKKMPFQAGQRQLELLEHQQGESDLAFVRGEFYLFATCELEEPKPIDIADYLGVDMGIANLATTNDGERYSGKTVNKVRHRHRNLRQKLQKKGTWSAKRLLRKLSGKEARFANDVNHCIAKKIVHKAKDTGRGIAVEDLTGIRERVRFRKPQRVQLSSWSFAELGFYIAYKAKQAGLPFAQVDPRDTSRRCSCCGHIAKANRPNQTTFKCVRCGFAAHADVNAAINIGRRATVISPDADGELGSIPA